MASEVEAIWKGEFGVPSDTAGDGQDLEIVRPSQPGNILAKLHRMLSERSEMKIEVVAANATQQEADRAEKLEKILRAYLWQLEEYTQRSVFDDGIFWLLLRGRAPWVTRLESHDEDPDSPRIRIHAHDPLGVFPVQGPSGFQYWTREVLMFRHELQDYFDSLQPDQLERMTLPDLKKLNEDGEDEADDWSQYVVVEYWDEDYYAWMVDGQLVECAEHGEGRILLSEARLNETPLNEPRWAAQGVLWRVAEDLKQIAALQMKAVNAVEAFYYPILLYKNASGRIETIDTQFVGEWGEVDETFQPVILNPTANDEMLNQLITMFQQNVNQGTISPVVFAQDLGEINLSGFGVAQILGSVKDDVADIRASAERAFARVLSTVLRLWEKHATQDEPGWSVPVAGLETGRTREELVTAEDIGGNYKVRVNIRIDLPQDVVQMTTIFNQLHQTDPATGMPRMDWMTSIMVSGLDGVIPDLQGAQKRRKQEWLLIVDEEYRNKVLQTEKALSLPDIEKMDKTIDRMTRRRDRTEQRRVERAIEQGLSADVVIPAEVASNPQLLHQFASMVEQGMTAQGALDQLAQGGPPLGVPGQQSPAPDDTETRALLDQLFGAGTQVAPEAGGPGPDGLTGYDNGIPPSVLPAPAQGALPRQQVDVSRLKSEAATEQNARGGLPPAR